jgi:hypothetical protein
MQYRSIPRISCTCSYFNSQNSIFIPAYFVTLFVGMLALSDCSRRPFETVPMLTEPHDWMSTCFANVASATFTGNAIDTLCRLSRISFAGELRRRCLVLKIVLMLFRFSIHLNFFKTPFTNGINIHPRGMPSSAMLHRVVLVRNDAIHSFETSVLTRVTRCNIAQDGILHINRRENLQSYIDPRTSFLIRITAALK